MNKLNIKWDDVFHRLKVIDKHNFTVYGVPKGGMIAAGFLRQAKITHDPSEATVILDDIVDSGKTQQIYKTRFPNTQFHALYSRGEFDGAWLVFPWEADHPAGEDTIEQNIVRQLQYIGEDTNRDGLIDTPKRVVKMWGEIYRGYDPKNRPNVSIFKNGSDGLTYDQMIIDTGDFYSHCEHHMVPFFGRYWFGYIPDPKGNIIGLSKVARIVDFHSARLQIQERLVHDVVEDIWQELSKDAVRPIGMGLIMEGEHLCKTMRGVKKKGKMTTTKLKGAFFDNMMVRDEFLRKTMNNY